MIETRKLKKAIKEIWKYVLPLIFLLFSVNSYSQFPRSVKSYLYVYYKYKDVLDKQDTLKIVEPLYFKPCNECGHHCIESVNIHQYVKTNRNTIIYRFAEIDNIGDSLIISKNAKMPDKKWCSEAAYSIEIPLENSDTGKLKLYEDIQRISIVSDKDMFIFSRNPNEWYSDLCNKEQAKYNLTIDEFLEELKRLKDDPEVSKTPLSYHPMSTYENLYKADELAYIEYGTDSIDKDRSWGYRISGNFAIFNILFVSQRVSKRFH